MIKKSILIIDDDIILLKTAEEILSDLYSVSVAKGGKQGIALLKKGIIPNLILLDIAMPEMDGYMTLEKIKGIPECEEVPVIFLTGFSESDYEVKGLKAGATDYIVKPFAKEVLLARVEMHLARSAQNSRKTVIDTQIQENRKRIQESLLNLYLQKTVSVRDTFVRKSLKENFYHGILLGILSYKNDWRVSSNRESGEGFSDIVIETGDAETGIVIEVKYTDEKKDLERDCRKALEQIRDKNYTQILWQEGYKKMVQYGIAFHLKQCCVMEEEMQRKWNRDGALNSYNLL